ncbi:MAG TPA: hypothetical protein PLH72_18795, partial [Vicinamibacterales bacterium]|nr:hypothetical protein [Vicinamibacterales bacterium]
ESQPSKLLVAGSIPVSRSIRPLPAGGGGMARRNAEGAQAASLRSLGWWAISGRQAPMADQGVGRRRRPM